jgi:hypothetical protein
MAKEGPLEASATVAGGVSREILAGDASGLGGMIAGFEEEVEAEEEFSLPAELRRGKVLDVVR